MLFFLQGSLQTKPNAFCSVPVADLVGISMKEAREKKLPITSYESLPFAASASNGACTRLTQILFNEVVEILDEVGDEVKVKIYNWYHTAGKENKKQTIYWGQKSAFTRFKDLAGTSFLPQPISFAQKKINNQRVITLSDALADHKNKIIYSAGTRFKIVSRGTNNYKVHAYNPQTKTVTQLAIPKAKAIGLSKNKRQHFVNLLKKWVSRKGTIPYVLGGASIGVPYPDGECCNVTYKKHNGKNIPLYYRNNNQKVHYGVDCAHGIARAAQAVGLPFFVKNTHTFATELPRLKQQQPLENGDILVWKGHTAVVSDVTKGLIIESRGYSHHYGKVQEIPLSEQFKGINTFDDLKKAYFQKQPLVRLDKMGKEVQKITDLAIVKLPA